MQFQVPQFLDVEDKIVGPLTIKQFIYVAGGAGLTYMSWKFVPVVGWLLAIGCVALGGALAFYRYNNKPFAFLIQSGFAYLTSNRLYIWRRANKVALETHLDLSNFNTTKHTGALPVAGGNMSKLNDLTWSMDIDSKESVEAKSVHSDSLFV